MGNVHGFGREASHLTNAGDTLNFTSPFPRERAG